MTSGGVHFLLHTIIVGFLLDPLQQQQITPPPTSTITSRVKPTPCCSTSRTLFDTSHDCSRLLVYFRRRNSSQTSLVVCGIVSVLAVPFLIGVVLPWWVESLVTFGGMEFYYGLQTFKLLSFWMAMHLLFIINFIIVFLLHVHFYLFASV